MVLRKDNKMRKFSSPWLGWRIWTIYIRDVCTCCIYIPTQSEIDWLLRSLELWCTVFYVAIYIYYSAIGRAIFFSICTLEGNSLYSTYVSFPYESDTSTQKSIPSTTTRWPCSVYRTIRYKHTRQKFSRSPWMQRLRAKERAGGINDCTFY